MNEEKFARAVKKRMYQLKRSKLFKKKVDSEIGEGKISKEEAEDYIKNAAEISINEIKEENLKKNAQ